MPLAERDYQCREIFTKAVCGKGRLYFQATHTVRLPETPSSILGCWVINHTYTADKAGEAVELVGSYDINIWYSFDNNTKTAVAKETVSYVEKVTLNYFDTNAIPGSIQIHSRVTQAPSAVEATVTKDRDGVLVKVEGEFYVEAVAETKLCVLVYPPGCSDDDKFDEADAASADSPNEGEELDPDILLDDLD
ncbi:MAG TPA: outer spore coat protein CotE [Calditerricola sp.]